MWFVTSSTNWFDSLKYTYIQTDMGPADSDMADTDIDKHTDINKHNNKILQTKKLKSSFPLWKIIIGTYDM